MNGYLMDYVGVIILDESPCTYLDDLEGIIYLYYIYYV